MPELVNRFFDVLTVQKTGAVLLLEAVGYCLQTSIGMILLAFYHPVLLAFDLFLAAILGFILLVLGRGGVDSAIGQSKAKYAAVAWLEDVARTPLLFKSASGADYLLAQTDRVARDYLEACGGHFRVVMRQNSGALALHALAGTLLLGMGGWMVIERQLSLGQLIAAELVVSTMIYGLTRLGKTLDNYYELVAAMDKIGHLLDLPQERASGAMPEPAAGPCRISLRAVRLPHGIGEEGSAVADLDLAPGDRVALTGADGIGRGILLDVLYGLRTPAAGSVSIDGQDLRELRLGALRETAALVREAEIVQGSVLDNLRMGRGIPLAQVREALRAVHLYDYILTLPDGLDTPLNYHGGPLTPEYGLRLSLARAIAGRPRLLLLHRVLDRLDAAVAPAVIGEVLRPGAPWTVIVTTQSPAVLAHCNRVVRCEGGGLIEAAPGRREG